MKISHRFFLLITFIFLGVTNQAAFSQDDQDFLNQWRQQQQVSSVVVSVQNTETGHVFNEASGTTTLHGKIPVTTETLFGIGSITKTFVAAAILQLQEEHQLALDDPIGSFFPQYPRWKSITIRQLLNMTSGIANYTSFPSFEALQRSPLKKMIGPEHFIDQAYAVSDKFSPGEGWYYSNTNYSLLGLLIEKVTSRPLKDVLAQRFFRPLHLSHTFYSASFYPYSVTKRMAHAYDGNHDATPFNFSVYGAAGSMLMNATDLRTWAGALFTPGIILKQASIDEMKKTVAVPPSPPKPLGARYGLGVYSLDIPGLGTVWYYAGVVDGYTSCFVYIPSQHKIIAAQLASWPKGHIYLLFPNQPLMQQLFKTNSVI